MAIIRTRAVRTRGTGAQNHHAVLSALDREGIEIIKEGNPILAKSPRAIRRNRWAADHSIWITDGQIRFTIDMLGDAHDKILEEIIGQLPVGLVDDQGVNAAIERLGRSGRMFGHAEISRLRTVLTPTEDVVHLAVGSHEKAMGILVLTTERVVFFDRGIKSFHVEEFTLGSIQSMGLRSRPGGEEVNIAISGREMTIKGVRHGMGEAFVSEFRRLRAATASPQVVTAAPVTDGPMDQLRKLAELRDAGVVTEVEFEAAKRDLLGKL